MAVGEVRSACAPCWDNPGGRRCQAVGFAGLFELDCSVESALVGCQTPDEPYSNEAAERSAERGGCAAALIALARSLSRALAGENRLSHTSRAENVAYAPAWARYRRLRRDSWLGILAFYLAGIAFAGAPKPAAWGLGVVVAAAVCGVFITGYRQTSWRCPRCHQPFFTRRWRWCTFHNVFARRCLNCGLPKWAPHDLGSPAN